MNRDDLIERLIDQYQKQLEEMYDEDLIGDALEMAKENLIERLREEAVERRIDVYRSSLERMSDEELGRISVVEATPEMFVEAINKAHERVVPWLYVGRELGNGVDFQRVRLAVALGQYARDGQHRHSGPQ
jgi:hypothetical protein